MTIIFPTNNVNNGLTISTKEELMAKLEDLAAQIAALG